MATIRAVLAKQAKSRRQIWKQTAPKPATFSIEGSRHSLLADFGPRTHGQYATDPNNHPAPRGSPFPSAAAASEASLSRPRGGELTLADSELERVRTTVLGEDRHTARVFGTPLDGARSYPLTLSPAAVKRFAGDFGLTPQLVSRRRLRVLVDSLRTPLNPRIGFCEFLALIARLAFDGLSAPEHAILYPTGLSKIAALLSAWRVADPAALKELELLHSESGASSLWAVPGSALDS